MKSKKRVSFIILVVLILSFIFISSYFFKSETPFDAQKAHKIDEKMQDVHFKGVLLMVQDAKIVYEQAYGQANKDKGIKNTLDAVYPIASLQKRMTAVMIAQLISEKKISYESKLADFCPDIVGAKEVSIRQLLDHTSGYVMPEITPGKILKTEDEQYDFALQLTDFSNAGTYQYSNVNYTFLARIISLIENKSYADSLHDRIIKPLNLRETFLWDQLPTSTLVPEEYLYVNQDYTTQTRVSSEALFSSLLGAGNVFASINDLLLFEKSLSDQQLLTLQEVEEVFNWSFDQSENIKSIRGNISELDRLGGYDSALYGTLDNKNIVVWLSNQAPVDETGQLLRSLYEIMMYE